MTNKEALHKLKEISLRLHEIDYEYIINLLKGSIIKIPLLLAKLHKDALIDRARLNDGNNLYTSVDQLSYIKNQVTIDKCLTEFGRANKPLEPMFYAALTSTALKTQRITAIAETSKLFQDKTRINLDGELYTVSRWKNNSELTVVEVVFSSEAIRINPDIKRSFENQIRLAKDAGIDDLEFYADFLIFISDQFARETKSHNDYKIAAAYTELALQHPEVKGIMFPSVQTKYMGANIVFPPTVVDDNLEILSAITQKLYKNPDKTLFNNHKECLNVKESPDRLEWRDTRKEDIMTKEAIRKHFKS